MISTLSINNTETAVGSGSFFFLTFHSPSWLFHKRSIMEIHSIVYIQVCLEWRRGCVCVLKNSRSSVAAAFRRGERATCQETESGHQWITARIGRVLKISYTRAKSTAELWGNLSVIQLSMALCLCQKP